MKTNGLLEVEWEPDAPFPMQCQAPFARSAKNVLELSDKAGLK